MTKLLEEKARELRTQGLTLDEITDQISACKNTINKWVKDIKLTEIQKCRINSKRNNYAYNIEIFEQPNALTYYLLGVFVSDGCVDKNLRRATITSKDAKWLETISQNICSGKPISPKKSSDCSVLTINSRYIARWLIDHQCIPNKSLTLQMPEIPNQYFNQFLRGVFDGDGCVTIANTIGKTKQLRTYIVSASKDFVQQLSNILNNNELRHQIITISGKNKKCFDRQKDYNDCYCIVFTCANAIRFCNFIYRDTNICLDRKYQVFKKYLEQRQWELENCLIRKKFDDPTKIIELLKSHTYKEVGDIYGITAKTVIDRLRKLGLHKAKRSY